MKKQLLTMFVAAAAVSAMATTRESSAINSLARTSSQKSMQLTGLQQNCAVQKIGKIDQSPVKNVQVMQKVQNLKAPISSINKVQSAAPEAILGSKLVTAQSQFKGAQSWSISIEQDSKNPDKVWFIGLVLHEALTEANGGCSEIYGTLSSDKSKITIPCGQQVATLEDNTKVYFKALNAAGNAPVSSIVATISDGVITIPSNYWGACVTEDSGWFELFQPGAKIASTTSMEPSALYSLPEGALLQGFTPDGSSFTNEFVYLPIQKDLKWNNKSSVLISEFNWIYSVLDEQTGEFGQEINQAGKDLSYRFETPSIVTTPVLNASLNGKQASFIYGLNGKKAPKADNDENPASFTYVGGGSIIMKDENDDYVFSGLTNACFDNICAYISAGNAVNGVTPYLYGTGCEVLDFFENGQTAVVQRFDKPISTLYMEGIDILLGEFVAPASTKFEMTIYTVEDELQRGYPVYKNKLASSIIYASDVYYEPEYKFGVMSFRNMSIENEDGFTQEVDYLELNEPFVVELRGFNVPGVVLSVRSEYENNSQAPNYSYFKTIEEGKEDLYSWNIQSNMFIQLSNAAYAYLLSDTESITVDKKAQTVSIEMTPYFGKVWEAAVENDNLPSWITLGETEHYNSENFGTTFDVTIAALPEGVQSRSFDLDFKTFGANLVIPVFQGITAGVDATIKGSYSAAIAGDVLELAYTSAKSATICTVAGKQVASYVLAADGKASIDVKSLEAGVYIVRFDGSAKSFKVVK